MSPDWFSVVLLGTARKPVNHGAGLYYRNIHLEMEIVSTGFQGMLQTNRALPAIPLPAVPRIGPRVISISLNAYLEPIVLSAFRNHNHRRLSGSGPSLDRDHGLARAASADGFEPAPLPHHPGDVPRNPDRRFRAAAPGDALGLQDWPAIVKGDCHSPRRTGKSGPWRS
jgi:hypothetical protein